MCMSLLLFLLLLSSLYHDIALHITTVSTVASTLCTVVSTTVAILSSDRQSLFRHIDSRSVSALHVFLSFTLLIFIVSQ
jgi:hypothetical protein